MLWPCLLLLGWMLPALAADKPAKVIDQTVEASAQVLAFQ